MPVDFLGGEIEVTLSDDKPPQPAAFRTASREYNIAERLATWQDNSFAGMRRRARGRRGPEQRTFYRVRTEEGEVYELYADWSPSRRGAGATRWYLHRRLSGAAEEEPAEAPATSETPPEEPARPQPDE